MKFKRYQTLGTKRKSCPSLQGAVLSPAVTNTTFLILRSLIVLDLLQRLGFIRVTLLVCFVFGVWRGIPGHAAPPQLLTPALK